MARPSGRIFGILMLITICVASVASVADSVEDGINNQTEILVTARALPDRCQLRTEAGPCKYFIHKWTFNKTEGECRTFVYGGCSGNENRFNSKFECLHYCVGGAEREFSTTKLFSENNSMNWFKYKINLMENRYFILKG